MTFFKYLFLLCSVGALWKLTNVGGFFSYLAAALYTVGGSYWVFKRHISTTANQESTHQENTSHAVVKNSLYEHFFDEMEFAAFIVDGSGKVVISNRATERLLGFQSFSILRQLEHANSDLYETITRGIRGSELGRKVCVINTRHTKLNSVVNITKQRHSENPLYSILITDIHEFLEQQKHDSWEKLVEVLTHEIMNSITPITSLASSAKQLIPYERTDDDDLYSALNVIERRSEGLLLFVEKYKGLTNVPAPSLKAIEVNKFLEDAIKLAQKMLNSGDGIISLRGTPRPVFIKTDPHLLEQVIINVLKNASEATSRIEFPSINVKVERESLDHIEICIRDNGVGITDSVLDDVFLPFFTTKRGGSGIGLAISKQICHILGHSINVANNLEQGAIISISMRTDETVKHQTGELK